ncbi:MAG: hypothetical protein HY875_08675 [Chloroflexi bacterium]|nr:hypothetical protein [Chloroflexota bacterium]
MAANPLLLQVSRMLGAGVTTAVTARALIASAPGQLAAALVREAADSDDVTSTEAAMDYLEGRLAELRELLDDATAAAVREAFAASVAAWGPRPG